MRFLALDSCLSARDRSSRTAHAVAAVVAEVAVAVADGDGAAVVAGRGVELEVGKLQTADVRRIAGAGEFRSEI